MKFLSSVLLLLFISTVSFSQEKESFSNLTSGKWHIESVEIEEEAIDVKNEGHWIVFYPDGVYQLYLDKEEQVGTWKLNDKKSLEFDEASFNGESFIKELDEKELKFSISGYTLALSK